MAACATKESDAEGGEDPVVKETIEQVLVRRTPELMRIPGVQGVGQALCDGSPCIRVYLADSTVIARLPDTVDGYVVSSVVTGVIRATTD
jgi:hypothetical protein